MHIAIVLSIFLLILSSCQLSSGITGAVVGLPSPVEAVEVCKNVTITNSERGTCYQTVSLQQCSDEPVNQSCSTIYRNDSYVCMIPSTISTQNCKITGYIIDDIVLDTTDYSCSVTNTTGTTEFICDSKFDGNGDGICSPGESCTKLVVSGSTVSYYEKNSRDDWVTSDDSFSLRRPEVMS